MDNYKIPTIVPDKYYSTVINKEKIINFLKAETSSSKIEQYVEHNLLVLKNYPKLKIDDVVEIIDYSNYRINQLKGIDRINEVIDNTKKEVSKLDNIEIIYTPYFMNDKNKNGFRYDATYIRIKDELYEIRNVERVMVFLGNKEMLKDLSEKDIIEFIKQNSDLLKANYLKDQEGKITSEEIEEEIEKESDLKIRDALLAHKDDVVKEREKLQEYINNNFPSAIVHYSVNSNEERIYLVNDKIIKFVGKEREMQMLDSKEIENMKNGEFNKEDGYTEKFDSKEYNELDDFIYKEDYLLEIVEKLYREEILTEEEVNMLSSFIELYIDNKEQNIEVRVEYDEIVNKWYENTSIDEKYPNQKMEELYGRVKAYRKNRVKIYEPDKLNLNNSAFISTFVILEGSLVIGLITALILLFK